MKVRNPDNRPVHKIRSSLRKRKWLTTSILGMGGTFGAVVLFFTVFNYGGFLYQSGRTQYYKQLLKDVSKFDFSFIKNYAEGQLTESDDIKIDIKFKHLLRIRYLREQAIRDKVIDNAIKEEEFPAKLTCNGKTHNVKISLTGRMSRAHLGNPTKWSFQVKVRGNDTVKGMKRFGLLVPTTRGQLTDWLSEELMKERGLIGLRIDFAAVSINGKSAGVYYLEERFDKHLIENNRLREGIIFKLEKEVLPYKETKLMQTPASRAQLLMLKRMWQDVMAGHLPPQQFFDLEKMAKLFVIADLFGNQHPLSKENLRFYFNPVTGLVEPIAREFEDVGKSDPATLRMFLEKPTPYTVPFWHRQESIIGLIYNNVDFKRFYIREAATLCQKEYLDDFFRKKKDKINAIRSKFYRNWPYYKLPLQIIYENQRHIRSVIFPDKEEIAARWVRKEGNQIRIHLQNLQDLPLEITHLSWRDTAFFYPEETIILELEPGSAPRQPRPFNFRIPRGFSPPINFLTELKLHYNMLGLPAGQRTVPVYPSSEDYDWDFSGNEGITQANYPAFEFIEEKEDGAILFIPAGAWTLTRDLVIPKNKRLLIEAGARINLLNHAELISYSPVSLLGEEKKPVVITSSDATSEGLTVMGAEQRSNLIYTNFDRLSASQEAGRLRSGTVTFFESPVSIISCTFSNNKEGEDLLRIIRSEFSMHQTRFENVEGDAFDCDDCTGTIGNSSFFNIGKDGLDFSGAAVKISNVFMNAIGNNGLSAADNSRLEARWIDIRRSGVAILCKDRSTIVFSDAHLANSRIGLAVFQEKPEFGPAFASAAGLYIQQAGIPFLIEKNSVLVLEGAPVAAEREKVEEIVYGKREKGKGKGKRED